MNTFKKSFGIISYFISFGFLLICVLGILIILDRLLVGDLGSLNPVLNQHFIYYILPKVQLNCGYGVYCGGPIWESGPKKLFVIVSIITGLISFVFYKLGKRLRKDNEIL